MTHYERGFLSKLAENGISPDTLRKLYGPETTEKPKYLLDDVSFPSMQLTKKPGFMERNPWIWKMMVNQVNGRYGDGTRLFSYTHRF